MWIPKIQGDVVLRFEGEKMNVLFLSLGEFDDFSAGSVHIDLIKEFAKFHNVYLVCKCERRKKEESGLKVCEGINVLKVKTGNLKNVNIVEKGISTVLLESQYIRAIKKFFKTIPFDLVLYTTPPITFAGVISYLKKHTNAKTYLLLKDIFPQNAVDIGMLCTSGIKGMVYNYFRRVEKRLYSLSDYIGCMSPANVDYVLRNNPEVNSQKVGICPNAIQVFDKSIENDERIIMRNKYNIPLDKKVFVYGGNLGKPQGIPFLIECLRTQVESKDKYFIIVGGGTEYNNLLSFFDDTKPDNMKLMEGLPRADYDRLVAACDVGMIFLDHRFTIPNFPSRLLSYMQAKLPVLACTDPNTDVGKVIEEGNFGVWCESNDTAAFAKAVDKFGDKSWGENAFKYLCDNYSVESAYKTIMNCMEK